MAAGADRGHGDGEHGDGRCCAGRAFAARQATARPRPAGDRLRLADRRVDDRRHAAGVRRRRRQLAHRLGSVDAGPPPDPAVRPFFVHRARPSLDRARMAVGTGDRRGLAAGRVPGGRAADHRRRRGDAGDRRAVAAALGLAGRAGGGAVGAVLCLGPVRARAADGAGVAAAGRLAGGAVAGARTRRSAAAVVDARADDAVGQPPRQFRGRDPAGRGIRAGGGDRVDRPAADDRAVGAIRRRAGGGGDGQPQRHRHFADAAVGVRQRVDHPGPGIQADRHELYAVVRAGAAGGDRGRLVARRAAGAGADSGDAGDAPFGAGAYAPPDPVPDRRGDGAGAGADPALDRPVEPQAAAG